jgi:hypothetical protein
MKQTIETIEGALHKLNVNFSGDVDFTDCVVYGNCAPYGCCKCTHFEVVETTDTGCELIIPALKCGVYKYQLFLKLNATNQEFLILDGDITVKDRLCDCSSDVVNDSSATIINATISADTVEVNVTIEKGPKGDTGPQGPAGESGISTDDLVNLGLLDEWQNEEIVFDNHLGSSYGLGTAKPTFRTISPQYSFTYNIAGGGVKINRFEFFIGVIGENPPTILVNGTRLNFVSANPISPNDNEYGISYTTPGNNEIELIGDVVFTVINAAKIGGGPGSYMNSSTLVSETLDGVCPYVGLQNIKNIKHTGIEYGVYNILILDNENKLADISSNTTLVSIINDSIRNYSSWGYPSIYSVAKEIGGAMISVGLSMNVSSQYEKRFLDEANYLNEIFRMLSIPFTAKVIKIR